ncbi:MAG: M50 family metallopeptidase [Endomicrobiales bacterium]|nr:M50 family metallopeptidase [Endomicrobiales bacterium]
MLGLKITLLQLLSVVFGIGLLVLIHELGHFMFAKIYKIAVEKFTIGFGPELFGFTKAGTRYSICLIPLGGMVKMKGEDVEGLSGAPDEFFSQAWYKRLIIALFGPLMNYFLAAVLFAVVFLFWGVAGPSKLPYVGEVKSGMPAAMSGVLSGDLVKEINGKTINKWEDISQTIAASDGAISFILARGTSTLTVNMQADKDPVSGRFLVGIAPKIEFEKLSSFSSIKLAIEVPITQTVFTAKYLYDKITQGEKPELAGPIGVMQFLGKAASDGLASLLYLLGVLSVALGMFNLFPIPVLDGGHIMFAIIEGVSGRKVSAKAIQVATLIGFVFLISVMVFATYGDIARIISSFKK